MTHGARQERPTPPTLEAVAEAAGVSRATVSRVVNASPTVRPEVVDIVNAAIGKLNYVPNRAARSLASRQTQAIALVVPEDPTRFFGDPYFAAIVQGITRRLDESEYILNLLVASDDPAHKAMRYLRSGNVDGALIVSHHDDDEYVTDIATVMPSVFGGRPPNDADPGSHYVDIDNIAGAQLAARHLIDIGRTRIGTITGPVDMPAGIDRLNGFLRTLEAAGVATDAIENADFTASGAATATRRLLDRIPDADALFVASDLMATGALTVLRERGLSIPGDIAVVGFDDSPLAASADVPLTTVSQPSTGMGFAMADMLLRLLSGDETVPHRTIMPTRLVLRASA
ncbi:LacI family DNA-binding transcriptional regulator [Luethyella okanaganae]|uniref:LacI family DNA-binding transcriptional regulator n=1 Tax=Luethyella okanaganae TaxID=69372 RepID=A0ABW1VG90_9MICO